MLCQPFERLTPREKSEYIGLLTHACMNDEIFYSAGAKIIKQAEKKGIYEGVTINPAPITEPLNPE